ncbi:ANK REP REGION domain-containing protein [Citrus sinensis]|uniref:ANK REP REGION domain-containing protein n=1 Tax=Citrus sinensis TaxID=2711 RepID=A0ACB8K8Y8_CITSI|nr:ANK REP REGION domain-containing protein [Citrus sinensis]
MWAVITAMAMTYLLELLQQDPLILERPTVNCLSETPLHILCQKPELARKSDSRKSSALHIASQKGYVGICSATDVDGRNALHLAAMEGHIDVLEELTILHLCVQHNQLEALKSFLETREGSELLNANDDNGMTILHLAVADKQIEIWITHITYKSRAIKFFTTSTAIEVNAVNANGFTAWDILAQSKRDIKYWEIGELLRRARGNSAKDMHLPANELAVTQTNSLTSHENNQKHEGKKDLKGTPWNLDDWLKEKRNAAMIVATGIATMGFQAGVNPPNSSRLDASSFVAHNTLGFLSSLSVILLLLFSLPINRTLFVWIVMIMMGVAIGEMAWVYAVSIDVIGETNSSDSTRSTIVTRVWIVGVFLGNSSYLMVPVIKFIIKSIRRSSHIQAQDGRDNEPPIASIV